MVDLGHKGNWPRNFDSRSSVRFHSHATAACDKIEAETMCSHPAIPGMPMLKRFRRGRRDRGRRPSR